MHVTGYLSSLICTFLDVNECAIANGGCEHECINTEGSFYCDCRDGHMLESNNRTCEGNENPWTLKPEMILYVYCTDMADCEVITILPYTIHVHNRHS